MISYVLFILFTAGTIAFMPMFFDIFDFLDRKYTSKRHTKRVAAKVAILMDACNAKNDHKLISDLEEKLADTE